MDFNVANEVFPNKEAILRAMGFSEFPTRVDVLQMLYYIITNSCWYNDILMRYMPNYRQDLLVGFMLDPNLTINAALGNNLTLEAGLHSLHDNSADTPFFASSFYSYDRYLRCALIEYNKLFRYMKHCSNKGLCLDYFCGELRVFLYDDSVSVENNSIRVDTLRAPSVHSYPTGILPAGEEKLEDLSDVLRTSNNEGRSPELFEVFVSLNKQKIRDILKTRSSLLFYKNEILDNIDVFRSEISNDEPDFEFSNVETPFWVSQTNLSTPELFTLQDNVVDTLRQKIQYYEHIAESSYKKVLHYRMLKKNMEGLKSKLENLQQYKLIDDLNMRTVEFCAPHLSYWSQPNSRGSFASAQRGGVCSNNSQRASVPYSILTTNSGGHRTSPDEFGYGPICFSDEKFFKHIPIGIPQFVVKGEPARVFNVSMLPTELIRIISYYVGEDVLESVRQISIMNRFFPTARDDVMALLKQWRNVDLTNYYCQVFLRYRMNFERNRYRRISVTKSTKKDVLIENILDGNFKLTFYEFLRDVFILSRILNSRRRVRRTTCK